MTIPQDTHPALTLLREDPLRFAAQGSVATTWRTYRGRRLGPYYRLTWRENRRQHALYLGRQSPLVDEVLRLLQNAQAPLQLERETARRIALQRKHLIRPIKRYLDRIVRLFGNGLYLKGWELRGFKTAGPRLTAADVPEHLIPEFPLPLPHILAQFHTNPKRKRGQPTPSPNTPVNRERKQETHTSHNPSIPRRSERFHSPSKPRSSRTPEFPHSVDQKYSRPLPIWPTRSPRTRHSSEFRESVDQNHPPTVRSTSLEDLVGCCAQNTPYYSENPEVTRPRGPPNQCTSHRLAALPHPSCGGLAPDVWLFGGQFAILNGAGRLRSTNQRVSDACWPGLV